MEQNYLKFEKALINDLLALNIENKIDNNN